MNGVHYSSKKHDWGTPQSFFDRLNEEFAFTLDAAASTENAKCPRYFTESDNGLIKSFKGERVWINPPYGREIGKWVEKAATEPSDITVMLIPARTDTAAWHEYIFPRAEVRFIRGRLNFSGERSHGHNAPFPVAVVIFRF